MVDFPRSHGPLHKNIKDFKGRTVKEVDTYVTGLPPI
jgi:hypothetical protein